MSLIDADIKEMEKSKTNELFCKECNKKINSASFVLLCEDCFNKNIANSLEKIKENLIKIDSDLKQVDLSINKIHSLLSSFPKPHLMIVNKLEIDLLNFESIKKKLLIDKELNEKAFVLNQVQANKIREELKWSLFKQKEIKDLMDDI